MTASTLDSLQLFALVLVNHFICAYYLFSKESFVGVELGYRSLSLAWLWIILSYSCSTSTSFQLLLVWLWLTSLIFILKCRQHRIDLSLCLYESFLLSLLLIKIIQKILFDCVMVKLLLLFESLKFRLSLIQVVVDINVAINSVWLQS